MTRTRYHSVPKCKNRLYIHISTKEVLTFADKKAFCKRSVLGTWYLVPT